MNDLLVKTQARLGEKLLYLPMRSGDERAIYITTAGIVPRITAFPAIALKDGATDHKFIGGTLVPGAAADEYSGEFDDEMQIRVTGFVNILREEGELITGDGTEKGIIELIDDIRIALTGWVPSAAYNEPLLPLRTGESQIFEDPAEAELGPSVLIQTKEIIFTCAKQR